MSEHSTPSHTLSPSSSRLAHRAWSPSQAHDQPALTVWVLHGILGSKQNWTRFSQRLHEAHPELLIRAFDLRCHGDSEGFSAPHTVRGCAQDLITEAALLGAPDVLIGHSFGGKVALAYGAKVAAQGAPLKALWTLDSPLEASPRPGHGEVAQVIETCARLPMPQPSRRALSQALTHQGLSLGIAQWMTTNLKPSPQGGFEWRFDITGIQELMRDYWRLDAWALLGVISQRTRLYLLRAEHGMRWSEASAERLAQVAPHANSPVLSNSGHWVHIDQPEALLELISASLKAL